MANVKVALSGEFTIFTAQAVQAELLTALEGGGDVDVDLSQVSEMDSAGLQLMLAAKRSALTRGQALRFSGHSKAVVDTLDLCDLTGHFGDPVLIPKETA